MLTKSHHQPFIASTSISTNSEIQQLWQAFQPIITQPEMLGMSACVVMLFILQIWVQIQGNNQKLATARWATNAEKIRLVKKAIEQLQTKKVDEACLYCGSFEPKQMEGLSPSKIYLTGYPPTLPICNANQSMEVVGCPGSGKTFSVIDPAVASAIEQGYPILLYDYKGGKDGKGGQIPYLATLAARYGYKVRIFAPGRDYSCRLNPLDFIRDQYDMTTAKSLARTFHDNIKGKVTTGDQFFQSSGERLIYAIFQLAKGTPYQDLVMAFAFLKLSDLPKRLVYAKERGIEQFSFWVNVGFEQLMSLKDAPVTYQGILANAGDLITEFMQLDLVPSYMGKSNTSLKLGEKEILIFQSDTFRQKVVNPINASLIELSINYNFSDQREIPLVCAFDEVPTILIGNMPNWANEHRSKGYVGIYGFQSMPQLERAFGREGAAIFRSALGHRFWFNPGSLETAKAMSDFLGQKEVRVNTSSTSQGWSGGGQRSQNEHIYQLALKSHDAMLRFPQGRAIYISSGVGGEEETKIPWDIKRIKVSQTDQRRKDECQQLWFKSVLPGLQRRENHPSRKQLDEAVAERLAYANQLFPLPPDEQKGKQSSRKRQSSHKASYDPVPF